MTSHALRAEWTKLTTLRSLWTNPLIAVALTVGITAAAETAFRTADVSRTGDPGIGIFYGLNFGQVALVCFGILLIGQEYASGTIRTSLTAVPRRGALYGAKMLVGVSVGLATGAVLTAGAFLASATIVGFDLSTPGTVRCVVAGALYPPLLVVICLGATAMLRNLTAAMGLLVPTVFLGSNLLSGVPGAREVVQFLPDRAGLYALRYRTDPHIHYGHWTGLLLMAFWAAAAAFGGVRSFQWHDA